MELRPCKPGTEYHGPVRVPVQRRTGEQTFNGVVYRPVRQFWHLRTAAFNRKKEHFQEMADQRRSERKAHQEQIKVFGPDDVSELDESTDPLDATCKILKFIEHDDKIRLFYRRQA